MQQNCQAGVGSNHWLVMSLHGRPNPEAEQSRRDLLAAGFEVVLVDNNPQPLQPAPIAMTCLIRNGNCGGLAGGLNRGVERAMAHGASYITLLDQDSILDSESLMRLRGLLERFSGQRLLAGPRIWDQRRQCWHQLAKGSWCGYPRTRLLISSGTTFAAERWEELGPFNEWLFIDFVDHAWCFRAQAMGFVLLQHPGSTLRQQFGALHPSRFCRRMGLELYAPLRHFYSLRNLRWLLCQPEVPQDLRIKEVLKMLVKPWLWLLFEPRRGENWSCILQGLQAPIPVAPPPSPSAAGASVDS